MGHSVTIKQSLYGLILSFVGLLCLPTSVAAENRILEKAHWEDTSAQVTFEQLSKVAVFKPYDTILNKGFTPSANWVRVKIAARQPSDPDRLVLVIRPIYLDQIELYDPADAVNQHEPRLTGDAQPWAEAEFESIHHTFVIPALSQERYVYLRLVSTSTHAFYVQALTPKAMLQQENKLLHLYAALMAGLFTFWILVVLAWLRDREPLNGLFVIRQIVLIVYTACFLGYHRLLFHNWIDSLTLDHFYSWVVTLMPSMTYLFEYRMLSEYKLPKWSRFMLWAIVPLVCIAPVFMAFDLVREALQLNVQIVGLLSVMVFVIALSIQQNPQLSELPQKYQLPKFAVVTYYCLVFLILIFFVLPTLGVIKASLLTVYGILFYGLSAGLFMTVLLIVRSKKMEDLRIEISQSLLKSQSELAAETLRRQDQSRLLSMLMHEIKTPLAVIDMAMASRTKEDKATGYIERAIDNMKSILDRCVQTDRMIDRGFQINRQTLQLSKQIDNWVQERKEGPDRFELNLQPNLQIDSDLQCLQIIVSNLMENAFKHGHPTASLVIKVEGNRWENGQPGVLVSFSNLPGASAWPDEAQLFGKYYRSGPAQRVSGTGLGLYLSRNLAEQLGGSLRYRTDQLHLIFELWLPS